MIERTDQPQEVPDGSPEHRTQRIILSNDALVRIRQSKLHLDQLLRVPEWLHLGVDFRTRYEAYNQPVKKNETTGGEQYSERTAAQIGIHYKGFRLFGEFLDARPLYNYDVTVSSKMEDRTDLLQLYASLGTDNFLGSGLPTELQIGKFTQDFDRRRLIATTQYNNVPYSQQRPILIRGRSLDVGEYQGLAHPDVCHAPDPKPAGITGFV